LVYESKTLEQEIEEIEAKIRAIERKQEVMDFDIDNIRDEMQFLEQKNVNVD